MCGLDNREGVKFCEECGAKMELTCPGCGSIIPSGKKFCGGCGRSLISTQPPTPVASAPPSSPPPASFANGRYAVKKFLGEGGKKKVYLVHDSLLDRDVAFALIKTEKLDAASRQRISREAQAMGRLGDHPNIVGIYDMGEEKGQPYVVLPLLPGGDVEGLMEKAPERRLPIERSIDIAKAVCRGLEYAHSKGVIHRDIKPGNVWLNADGIAQIGDFGLALALDLSRLTNEGMMVGTYYYMPPEQAMGGEVSPQADLYSLGAMLYEMVAGRPPFTGDDTVAIIGQHINTPPVSPSWHRPELSPALSALIMRLLEKDPHHRPASAGEVLKALEVIETGNAEKVTSREEAVLTENPLYRRVFVGREPELRQLQSAFDLAASGQGSLMMVVGEPGIGKTSLSEQLATYATLRGGQALVGHCYEEGSLSLPYLAFVEALRSYAGTRDISELQKELGPWAADVARIVSEVRERLSIPPRLKGDPEEERYRLMQAVSDFLGNVAANKPLVIVLEDLHCADRGTLEMLGHVARNLGNKRLLLVGTYRDIEVDRTHPLSSSLADLRRLPTFSRVLLRGLNADEVRRMLAGIAGQEVPWGLAQVVHRQTEGNPLFVQEVIRYLAEEGVFVRDKGRWQPAKDTPVEMRIPDGLRDVIGKRLSSLSETCNRLLSTAAVIGRDFRLEVLQRVAGLSDEDLFKALEEARKAAVIEERTGTGAVVNYRFAHAFFRQTLYEEIIAPRRIRLHQQVARALEEVYKNRLAEHAAELAEHFSYSSDSEDLKKAISYSEMAAERATSVFDYGEAVRLLEKALQVQEVLDPEDKIRMCDLLLSLGDTLTMAGNPRRALDHEFEKAFHLAEDAGSRHRAAKAAVLSMTALRFYGWGFAESSPEMVKWVERADRYAKPGSAERVKADIGLGTVKMYSQYNEPFESWVSYFDRALELSRELKDPGTFWETAGDYLFWVWSPDHAEKQLELAEEILLKSHAGVNIRGLVYAMGYAANVFLARAHYEKMKEIINIIQKITDQSNQIHNKIGFLVWEIILKLLDGELSPAVQKCHELAELGEKESLVEFVDVAMISFLPRPLQYLGISSDVLNKSRSRIQDPSIHGTIFSFLHNNQLDKALELIDWLIELRMKRGASQDETLSYPDVFLLEACIRLNHTKAIQFLYDRLKTCPHVTSAVWSTTCTALPLGRAAELLGHPDEALSHYRDALKVAISLRYRPEIAIARYEIARLLLEKYPEEKKTALEHLDFAIGEFREMKMQPFLERALRHKEILKA